MQKERVEIDAEEISKLNEQINAIYKKIVKDLEKLKKINEKDYNTKIYVYKNKIYYTDAETTNYTFVSSKEKIIFSLKQKNLKKRKLLKKDEVLYEKIKTLDEIFKEYNILNIYETKTSKEKQTFFKTKNFIDHEIYEHDDFFRYHLLPISDGLVYTKFHQNTFYIDNVDTYKNLQQDLYETMIFLYLNKNNKHIDLFNKDNCIYLKYRNKTLEDYDLSLVNFDQKNISGLNISKNPEVRINFDKIIKDVSDCNFNGYDLSKVTFRDFNIKNTDFRNTSATIDLATCTLSREGKMNPGTLFDENNKFVFHNKPVERETIDKLGIKICKKVLK